VRASSKLLHLAAVAVKHDVVSGAEQERLLRASLTCAEGVQGKQPVLIQRAVTDPVQEVLEHVVLLAEDCLEFYGLELVSTPHLGIEEPRGLVLVRVVPLLVRLRYHRRELIRVSEHDDLEATERLVVVVADELEIPVHGIHEVCGHHRDLIDNDDINAL
jgi:hypothetical protein